MNGCFMKTLSSSPQPPHWWHWLSCLGWCTKLSPESEQILRENDSTNKLEMIQFNYRKIIQWIACSMLLNMLLDSLKLCNLMLGVSSIKKGIFSILFTSLSSQAQSQAQVSKYLFCAWIESGDEWMISIWSTGYEQEALFFENMYLN